MRYHISKVASTCVFHLRRLRRLRHVVASDVRRVLFLHWLITATYRWLDYLLSSLYHIIAAPATWNTLSDELRNPDLHSATFRRNLKNNSTILGTLSALEALCNYALYKFTFTLHLTYKIIPK